MQDEVQFSGVRIRSANVVEPPRGWLLPRRVLDDNELVYIKSGRGVFEIGRQRFAARAGKLFLLKAGVPHLLQAEPGESLTHWYIHFDLLDEHGRCVSLESSPLPEVISVPRRPAFEKLLLRCIHCTLNRHLDHGARMIASFFELWQEVSRLSALTEPLPQEPPDELGKMRYTEQVMSAVRYMMDHRNENPSMDEVAAHACLSPSHFQKIFKRITGSPPHTYLIGLKMERAKFLMLSEDYTLSEISDQIGFSSLPAFSRAFKIYEGMPPSVYCNRIRKR